MTTATDEKETENKVKSPTDYPFLVEEARPLGQSMIWTLLRDFYTGNGIEAWLGGGVPRYITSNPYIAQGYASMVRAFLEDLPNEQAGRPPLVVELGSGSGSFGFHFLRAFFGDDPMTFAGDPNSSVGGNIQYIMTDLVPENLRFQREHPELRKYHEAGVLEFEHLDLQDGSFEALPQYDPDRPLIIIANYIFDSLPQDVFRFREGRIFEGLVSLHADREPPDPVPPAMLRDLWPNWIFRATTPDFYEDEERNKVLRHYANELPDAVVALCPFAMELLTSRVNQGNAPMFLLIGDRGDTSLRELNQTRPPIPSFHGENGCFSLGFNFHALETLTRELGGRVLRTEHTPAWLNVAGYVSGTSAPRLERVYHEQVMRPGPDDFYTLVQGVEKKYANLSMAEILTLLRFSYWDPTVFQELYPMLHERVQEADVNQRQDLIAGLPRIRAAYYRVNPENDLDFRLGYLAFNLQAHEQAIEYFEASIRNNGEHADKFFNIALCHNLLGRPEQARRWNNRSLQLDPASEEALELQRLLGEPEEVSATSPE